MTVPGCGVPVHHSAKFVDSEAETGDIANGLPRSIAAQYQEFTSPALP